MCRPVAPSGNGVTRSTGWTAPVPSVARTASRCAPGDAGQSKRHCTQVSTDGTGVVQPEARATPFPDGATGWHTITVSVG